MKKSYSTIFLFTCFVAQAQLGINTTTPKATLDIVGFPEDVSKLDGIIVPKLTGNQLRAKMYTSNQKSAIVYVTVADTAPAGQTVNVVDLGYYYFDGIIWIPIQGTDWRTKGNAGTNETDNFIGTTDSTSLNFRVNNIRAGRLGGVLTYGAPESSVYLGLNSGLADPTAFSGYGNVGIGALALASTISNGNTAIGSMTLKSNTSGYNNTAIGYLALFNNIRGTGNVAIGAGALNNDTMGVSNIAIGIDSGNKKNEGQFNIFIGAVSGVTAAGLQLSNAIAIGHNAKVGISNSMVLGGTGADALNVGIGTPSPTSTLEVNGSVSTAITTVSASYLIKNLDYTIIFTGASTSPTFTLPDPATCKGRMYRLVNASVGATYQDVALSIPVSLQTGKTTTTLAVQTFSSSTTLSDTGIGNTAIIQSDGTQWWRVGL